MSPPVPLIDDAGRTRNLPRPRRTRTLYPPLSYSVVTIFMIVCGGAEGQEYLIASQFLIVRTVVAPHSLCRYRSSRTGPYRLKRPMAAMGSLAVYNPDKSRSGNAT